MSRHNPYLRGSKVARDTKVALATAAKPHSNENYVNNQGSFNAANKKDLANVLTALASEMSNGTVETNSAKNRHERAKAIIASNSDLVNEAVTASHNSKAWQALGAVVTDEIKTSGDREGIAANLLATREIKQGEVARWRVREKQVLGFQAVSPVKVAPSEIRQGYTYPDEFYIPCAIKIEEKEIAQNPGDILEEKLGEGTEQTMVVEDRIMRDLWIKSAGLVNDLFYFNSFNPTIFQSMKSQLGTWALTPAACTLAYNIWDDIVGDPEFSNWFDQVTKHELVVNGTLPAILGVPLITDGFREQHLKVLDQGEVFMSAQPNEVGGMTGRGEQVIEPTNGYNLSEPWRGWYFNRIRSIQIINARGIVRAIRN